MAIKNRKSNAVFLVFLLLPLLVVVYFIKNISLDTRSKASQTTSDGITKTLRFVHPNFHDDLQTAAWPNLFSDQNYWTSVLNKTDVFGFYLLPLTNHFDTLKTTILPRLKQKNIPLAIEVFGTDKWKDCNANRGEATAYADLEIIRKIQMNGNEVKYIRLDDSIARTTRGSQYDLDRTIYKDEPLFCSFDFATSIRETADYIQTIHKEFPMINIGYIVNFPNWEYKGIPTYWGPEKNFGNFETVLNSLHVELTKRGDKLAFLHVDTPYDYAIGQYPSLFTGASQINWIDRMRTLQAQTQSLGLRFGVIYNSYRGGNESDELYNTDVQKYLRTYLRTNTAIGQDIILESWYPKPNLLTAESTPYSFGDHVIKSLSTNVYRIQKGVYYRYTIDEDIKKVAIASQGYMLNGVAFQASPFWTEGFTPVYELNRPDKPEHYFYTSSAQEKNNAVSQYGYRYLGIAFYIPAGSQAPLVPVYRLKQKISNNYLYTVSIAERDAAVKSYGYGYEGIAFYVIL